MSHLSETEILALRRAAVPCPRDGRARHYCSLIVSHEPRSNRAAHEAPSSGFLVADFEGIITMTDSIDTLKRLIQLESLNGYGTVRELILQQPRRAIAEQNPAPEPSPIDISLNDLDITL